MTSTNYDNKSYIDIRKLRKDCAAMTGMHNTFSKHKKNRPITANDAETPTLIDQVLEQEDIVQRVCEESLLEDLENRIPPLSSLLQEMLAEHKQNRGSDIEIMKDLSDQLHQLGKRLQGAVNDFNLDESMDMAKQEQQLQTLSALREQVADTLELYNAETFSESSRSDSETEDFLRFSGSAVSTAQDQQELDLFSTPNDPFEVRDNGKNSAQNPFDQDPFAEPDSKSQALSLFNAPVSQPQLALSPSNNMADRGKSAPLPMVTPTTTNVVSQSTTYAGTSAPDFNAGAMHKCVDPFNVPFTTDISPTSTAVTDPFILAQTADPFVSQRQPSQFSATSKNRGEQGNMATQESGLHPPHGFDPFAPMQQTA